MEAFERVSPKTFALPEIWRYFRGVRQASGCTGVENNGECR